VRPNEGVLRDLFSVLLVAQELMHHRVNAIPVTGNHFVEGGDVAGLESIHEYSVKSYFLRFR
jgi:hypothetical protein